MSKTILIVDDDRELCDLLGEFLTLEGFATTAIHDGAQALAHCRAHSYDALILDIMLPGMQGLELLRALREFCASPVLMLTARGDETDRIVGLEMGADDYLPKPCNPRELAARLRAILRRASSSPSGTADTKLCVGATRLATADRSASYEQRPLQLTSAEFNILHTLLSNAGRVVDKNTLSEKALGRSLMPYDRSVDVHISKVRKKLQAAGGIDLIVAVRGAGYQFVRPMDEV